MDTQAEVKTQVRKSVQDFQTFVLSRVVSLWMHDQPNGTLEKLITEWRAELEARWAQAYHEPLGSSERLILEQASEELREMFQHEGAAKVM